MKSTQSQNSMDADKKQRAADRYVSELPIEINGAQGVTRNISATGIYFETTVEPEPGSKVHFTVDVIVEGEPLKMVCSGEVVRVDHKDGTVGIAVKLANSFFANIDQPDSQQG